MTALACLLTAVVCMAWCQIECDCIRDVSFLCECVSVCVGF